MKSVQRMLAIAASVALLTACGTNTTTTNNAPSASPSPTTEATTTTPTKDLKPVKVQLSFLMQSLDAPLILAINKGYFKEEGLDVSYERGFGNVDTVSKLGSGAFDISFSDMYNALDFNSKNPNDQIIAVAVYQNKAPFAIVTLKDKGINSVKELAGKKLGAPAGDGPRKLFPLLAEEAGFDPNSVTWTTMEPKLRETFLLQGKVDAVSAFAPSAVPALIKAGKTPNDINVFYYTDNGLDFYGNGILVKKSFAQQNPEIVKAFVRAYIRGFQDMIKDPTAGLDAVLAADPSKLMDRESERIRLQTVLDKGFITPEVETLGIGAVDPKRLETSIQQTVKGFGIKTNPTVADIYTDQYLPPLDQRQLPPASERKPLQ